MPFGLMVDMLTYNQRGARQELVMTLHRTMAMAVIRRQTHYASDPCC
jgi:hypothetical protein